MEHEADDGNIIAYNEQKSSSEEDNEKRNEEEEKVRSSSEGEKLRSSPEDEKLRSSNVEDEKRRSGEVKVKKRGSTNEEVKFVCKKAKTDICLQDVVFDSDSDTVSTENESDSDEYEGDELSDYSREEVEIIPVKSEEIKVELTDVEKWYYKGIGPGDPEKNHTCVWTSSSNRSFPTNEERKEIQREMKANEFDVPYFAWQMAVGTRRVNLTIEKDAMNICRCAKLALNTYNLKNGTNYALERLVRCMTRPCTGRVYLITFKAKLSDEDPSVTFQAKTWVQMRGRVHIMMCRIEPSDVAQPLLEAEKVPDCNQAISTN